MPFFDFHCDSLSLGAPKLSALCESDCLCQVFALFCDIEKEENPLYSLLSQLALLDRAAAERPDFVIAHSFDALSLAIAQGRTVGMLAVEDAGQFFGDCSLVAPLARLGVRFCSLCWNRENGLASPATAKHGEISARGRELLAALEEAGIAIDLSHQH